MFEVTFNEYVTLDKINEKFMVSPPLKDKPDISLKGKSLIVKWNEELNPNTTYTFYFQDAIRDLDEGNVLSNYQYSFSTGEVLDSLSFTGNVFNAEDLEAAPDVLVMLYSNLSDTAPVKTIPSYITKPDISGGFCINHIKPGNYRVYALNDLNGNRKYDGGDEKFGFIDSVISINPKDNYNIRPDTVKRMPEKVKGEATTSKVKEKPDIFTRGKFPIYLFPTEKKQQYLTSSDRKSAGSMVFTLALPADTAKFRFNIPGENDSSWYMESNKDRDTFNIWITDTLVYSKPSIKALIRYPFTDSTKKLIYKTDTVRMNFSSRQPVIRKGRQKKEKLLTQLFGPVVKPGATISFEGNNPLRNPDTARIYFVQVVDTTKTRLNPVFVIDKENTRKLTLSNKLTPGYSYILICDRNSLSDIFRNTNDSTVYRFKVGTEEEYGKINLNITGYSGNILVQLLDEKEKLISQKAVTAPAKVTYSLVDHGLYRLRVIYDIDGNGRWTTGSLAEKREPEPVSYFPQVLDVKINWEIDQDWDISARESKNINLRSKPQAKTNNQ